MRFQWVAVPTFRPCEGEGCRRYQLSTAHFRALLGESGDSSFSSKFGKACKRLFRVQYGKDPATEQTNARRRSPVYLYPCGTLETAYQRLRPTERPRCPCFSVRQRDFRALRSEYWGPAFISKFGRLAAAMYRELYDQEPPEAERVPRSSTKRPNEDGVNVYPYGILERAYAQLKAAGESIGEPYKPDPDAPRSVSKRSRKLKPRTEIAERILLRGNRFKERLLRRMAENAAKHAERLANGEEANSDADAELDPWGDDYYD